MPPPTKPLPPIRRLAVFRALQLGDMLCAVPALRALRAGLPQARITLVGLPWAREFVCRFVHYVDDFIDFPGHPGLPEQRLRQELLPAFLRKLQTRQFDLALQMHGDGSVSNALIQTFGAPITAGWYRGDNGAWLDHPVPYPTTGPEPLRLLHLVQALGMPGCGEEQEFPLFPEDEAELFSALPEPVAMPYLCLHAGARDRSKCWPAACFAQVADALTDEFGLAVVLTGSAAEADVAEAVASRMKHRPIDTTHCALSIGAMAALMNRARLLVCNDTGVSHIAAGLGLPSVVIFNRADMERWAPLNQARHRCIRDLEGLRQAEVLAAAREILLGDKGGPKKC